MRRAIKVKAMNNMLLLIKFDNGEERVFNCFTLLKDNLFCNIVDRDYFSTVHVDDMGLVCWDESTDINPFCLYEESESLTRFSFAS